MDEFTPVDMRSHPTLHPVKRPRGAEEVLRVINTFAISLLKQNRLEDLLWSIADNIGLLLDFEDSVIYLVRSGVLQQAAASGAKNPTKREINDTLVLKIGEGIVGRVASSKQASIISDTSICDDYVRDGFPGLSEVTVPVTYHDQVLAVIDAESSQKNAFTQADLDILTSIANIAAPRIASALADESRRAMEAELKQAKEELEVRVKQRTSALKKSMRDLEHERHLLHLTMLAVGDGLFAIDSQGIIMLASDAALRITNTTRANAIGRPLEDIYQTFDADSDGLTPCSLSRVPSVLEAMTSSSSTKIFCRGANGEFILDEMLSPIRDAQGATIGIVVVFRDVTLERAMAKKAQRGQQLESLGVLAGGIAHDFHNILSGILGRINLAQSCGGNEDVLGQSLSGAEQGCLAASGLTKELLAFAKGGSPVKSVGPLNKLITESASFCLHGSSVSLELDLQEDLHPVEMDAVQISQVLNNLVLNAMQAMPNGGDLLIRARNEPQGIPAEWSRYPESTQPANGAGSVVLLISDTGTGITRKTTAKIFDPYFTTKNTHSGLGLATSYWIVQRHRGLLRLVQSSAQGSSFELRLPAADKRPADDGLAPKLSGTNKRSFKVLLMDDDPMVSEPIAAMLERLGQTVEVASNGEQALQLFHAARSAGQEFELAFLDLTVRGGMGGKKTMELLRPLAPKLHSVVISGYSDDSVMSNHKQYGFDAMLAKPFTMNQLQTILSNFSSDSAR